MTSNLPTGLPRPRAMARALARLRAACGHVAARRLVLVGLLVALLTGCSAARSGTGTPTPVASPAPRTTTSAPATVVEAWSTASETEGTVQVYADLTWRETEELGRLLGRRYPKLRVEWTRGSDRALLARALAERNEGGATWDVFVGDAAPALVATVPAARWAPPEAPAIRRDLVDPQGQWFALALTYHVLEYNPELVPFGSRPTAYETLREPRFYGRLAVEEESLTWLKGMLESRGRQQALDLLRPLAAQGVVARRSPADLSAYLAAGWHTVAVVNRLDVVERDRRTGAKAAWVAIEPIVVQPTAVVVAEDAPRPNGARLVANFLLSADAQHALAATGRVPARVDVDPEPRGLVRGLQTRLTLPPVGRQEQELRALYADLWAER